MNTNIIKSGENYPICLPVDLNFKGGDLSKEDFDKKKKEEKINKLIEGIEKFLIEGEKDQEKINGILQKIKSMKKSEKLEAIYNKKWPVNSYLPPAQYEENKEFLLLIAQVARQEREREKKKN
ncbi:hypothetical protein CVV26_01325 [Candidatus Kuenenbacteria bacterium HGW-Kuenenbacteria-1]|uniref:Uncharacterized protein n=1 Tax=Candidatus Kuenenbacteria bacterium HGW-Kuenenbacteria-1 TaxID=2013812 RepID=A0A2N1UNY9_9BACT|nr:MAG: hypothetical protein CVV26_01325 [Candidatus Kuenenbacteria bacterium HGW-Kuenenbacteria-1]